jgi:hypothetical protein
MVHIFHDINLRLLYVYHQQTTLFSSYLVVDSPYSSFLLFFEFKLTVGDLEIQIAGIKLKKARKMKQFKKKLLFEDITCESLTIPSNWKKGKSLKSKKSIECQTGDELYNPQEIDVQTGRFTNIYQAQVESDQNNISLLEYVQSNQSRFLTSVGKKKGKDSTFQQFPLNWKQQIEDGYFTIDYEVEIDPDYRVKTDDLIEYIDIKKNIGIQTEKSDILVPLPSSVYSSSSSAGDEEKKAYDEGKESFLPEEEEGKNNNLNVFQEYPLKVSSSSLLSFLNRVSDLVTDAIIENNESKAFDNLSQYGTNSNTTSDMNSLLAAMNDPEAASAGGRGEAPSSLNRNSLWKCLTVDLEKKKILFPDWTKAKHFPGIIIKVTITRNKERIYDIEYEDGSKAVGVKEPYLRLIDSSNNLNMKSSKNNNTTAANKKNIRLFEEMRVHCRVNLGKGNNSKSFYCLGRIVKILKNSYDVEILETGKIELGLSLDDIIIGGLSEGQSVEARKPAKIVLQSTAVNWNATGSMIGKSQSVAFSWIYHLPSFFSLPL